MANDDENRIRVTELVIDNAYPSETTDRSGPITVEFGDRKSDENWSKLKATILDTLFPLGALYWTSDKNFNPNGTFTGKWARLTNTFIFAADKNDSVDMVSQVDEINGTVYANITTSGTSEVTLTVANLPPHTHTVNDPGHEHNIRTIGDDYNHSNNGGTNFTTDGASDMTASNRSRGVYAVKNTTGITVDPTGSGNPVNIMPPYIKRYCWERYE